MASCGEGERGRRRDPSPRRRRLLRQGDRLVGLSLAGPQPGERDRRPDAFGIGRGGLLRGGGRFRGHPSRVLQHGKPSQRLALAGPLDLRRRGLVGVHGHVQLELALQQPPEAERRFAGRVGRRRLLEQLDGSVHVPRGRLGFRLLDLLVGGHRLGGGARPSSRPSSCRPSCPGRKRASPGVSPAPGSMPSWRPPVPLGTVHRLSSGRARRILGPPPVGRQQGRASPTAPRVRRYGPPARRD